ncbi:MAG: hypothetical protein WC217_01245 [Candidatus Paceibacterota bacterium]|jgi:hypothetical protein
MSSKGIIVALGVGVVFGVGALFGFSVLHFPFIKFDSEVKIFDVLNFLLALGLGLWVPFIIKKAIDDNRDIKAYVVDDLKALIISISKVKDIISTAYGVGTFTTADRDSIVLAFHFLELEVSSIEEQVKISFPRKASALAAELKKLLMEYQDYLTAGELMLSSFQSINDRFHKEHGTEYSKIETGIKTLVHKIYKL